MVIQSRLDCLVNRAPVENFLSEVILSCDFNSFGSFFGDDFGAGIRGIRSTGPCFGSILLLRMACSLVGLYTLDSLTESPSGDAKEQPSVASSDDECSPDVSDIKLLAVKY